MKRLLAFFLLFFVLQIFSQKQANIWYFGQNAGLDFNFTPPKALANGELNTLEGCSTFSDANGNLLFYSDGTNVYDKNHTIMNYTDGTPGNNLLGDPSAAQSGMIIPKPLSNSIYYLFTVTDNNSSKGFNYYTIDMSLNGGNGQLIDENNDGNFFVELQGGNWTEKVAAVKGQVCNTFWIVTAFNNNFYSYLIDFNGVDSTPIISSVSSRIDERGYLKLSPDGTKLAVANQGPEEAIIYNFDSLTGEVANNEIFVVESFSGDGEPYGAEFSVDSKKLYISTVSEFRFPNNPPVDYKLFQFDLTATNIPNSKVLIHEQIGGSADYPEGGFRGAIQLGPDGKIYATIPTTYAQPAGFAPFLDVIENPTANAADVIFTKDAIDLDGRFATQGLPPFISSLILLPIDISDDSGTTINNQDLKYCIGDNVTFVITDPTLISGGSTPAFEWSFNDGTNTSVVSTTDRLDLLDLTMANSGTYTLKIELTNSCGDITEYNAIFNIEVFEPAIASIPDDINRCDTDRDGFIEFDLATEQNSTILSGFGPSVDLTAFQVLYFNDETAALSNIVSEILPNPYTNQNAFVEETIYARVQNIAAPNTCFAITEFKLKVTDVPTPSQPTVYRLCDDTASGSDTDGMSSFLLNTKDAQILIGVTNPSNYNISYHTDLIGAQTNTITTTIPKDIDYEVTLSQRVYVRIENNNNADCNVISDDTPGSTFTSFELIVDPLPTISSPVELKQCDNDTDGFSLFNLNEAASDISTNYLNETFVFYPSLLDAENNTSAFTAAEALVFRNRFVTTDTVWARAISGFGCYRISEVNLVVSTTGLPATFQRSFTLCDDFLDIDGNDTVDNDDTDGVAAFNFSSVTAEVRALFPASQQLTITYYRNQADALAEVDAITDTANYRNIGYPSTQQIYIRVDSDLDNDCLGFGPFITLTVDPVPTVNPVTNLIFCDNGDDGDFFNGIIQTFNLESQTPIILGTQDPLNFTVTYHTSDTDALSGANQILNTTMYENTIPNLETVYVRVANNTTTCFTNHTSFDLIVNELPIANFVDDLEVCDDNTDGSAQNGFSQEFDLELQTAGILGSQDPTQFSVTYHASLDDAQAGILPLGSPFSNSVPFSQLIYARVYNALTGCANGISNFNAIVNPEPTTENASNLSFCDDDLDGDDTNGFIQNIDLDSQITEILGTLQDPDDFTVTFHETQADATDGTDALSSPYTNTTADQQTIFVRVVNDDTLCVNDDFTFDVIINPLPDFKVTSPQIVCLSGPPLTLFIENPAAVYDYVWTAPNGNESFGSQITIESGGLYTVTATTTNGTLCTRTREIQVNESIVATITDADVTIVDDSENNSISIDPTNLGIGDYQYALINEDGIQTSFQDIPLFENLTGGFYTIVVEDKNGCRPNATLEVSVIEYPKFFTPNNDGINDTWAIKGANSTFYPTAQINIFNRFGKVVAQIEVDSPGWTGTYGGKTLPSDDYWFSIVLVDRNGNARERKGNFSLLRR